MYCLVPFSSPLGPAEIASNRWDASDLSARGRDWSDPSPGLLHESESGGGISPASPTPRPPPQTPGEAVTRRAEGVAWDSRGGEGAVCPWAERGGDSGRRGRRMRGLRVRAPKGRVGEPNPEALAPIRDSLNIPGTGALEREPPSGFGTPSEAAWDPQPPPNPRASETACDP